MKKLTAGIFTVMLGLCAANNADAAVASKGYVDSFVGENGSITSEVATLKTTVETNATSAANATAAVAKDLADYESANDAALAGVKTTAEQGVADAATVSAALGEYKTSNDARVQAVEGDVTTLQQDIAKVQGGELALKDGSVAKSKLTTELQAEIDSFATTAEMTEALALKGDKSAVEANASAISAINNAETGILAEAKKYADENDTDTVYDDAEVRGLIGDNADAIAANEQAIEANAGEISGLKTLVGTTAVADQIAAKIAAENLSQYAKTADVTGALADYELKANLKALAYKATVATADIDDGAVTTAKLADGAVDASKLGANAVTDAAVADGALSQDKINGLDTTLATKMTITNATSETGKYVFTANVGEDGVTDYAWELIERGEDDK